METKPPAAHKQSSLETAVPSVRDENDKGLRDLRNSRLYYIPAHPLIVVILGGVIGVLLTQSYAARQKQIEDTRTEQQSEQSRRRSFSDQLNLISVQRFGDVWQRIDEDELKIIGIFQTIRQESPQLSPKSKKNRRATKLQGLIQDDVIVLTKNKFWIGEELFNKGEYYLDCVSRYAVNLIAVGPTASRVEMETAKKELLETRNEYLTQKKSVFGY